MQRYGGALSLRDPGALESALYRPQTGYYKDIVAEAAALMESLAIPPPLWMETSESLLPPPMSFLRINGWQLRRAPMQIHPEMLQMLETSTFDLAHIEPWLHGFSMPSSLTGGY